MISSPPAWLDGASVSHASLHLASPRIQRPRSSLGRGAIDGAQGRDESRPYSRMGSQAARVLRPEQPPPRAPGRYPLWVKGEPL